MNFEFTDEEKKELDELKKLYNAGEMKTFTLAQAKAYALKKLKTGKKDS